MISLLVLVVILSIITHLLNTLGAQTINNLLWSLYTQLPTKTARDVHTQKGLQREIVKLRSELRSTSSQDEFAKWAKLKRTHDKKLAEMEKLNSNISTARLAFDSKAHFVRWTLITGLRFFLQFWYSREAIFWIPKDWVPSYVEWGLSFPRAPTGSVSIQVWTFAAAQAMRLVFDAVTYVFVQVMQKMTARMVVPTPVQKERERKKIK